MFIKCIPGKERRETGRWKYDCHLGFGLDRARLRSIDQPMQSRTRSVYRKDKNIPYICITHFSTETLKLTAALVKSSFPHFCWTAGPKISQHLLPET